MERSTDDDIDLFFKLNSIYTCVLSNRRKVRTAHSINQKVILNLYIYGLSAAGSERVNMSKCALERISWPIIEKHGGKVMSALLICVGKTKG